MKRMFATLFVEVALPSIALRMPAASLVVVKPLHPHAPRTPLTTRSTASSAVYRKG
jgi:hypothetical protein